MTSTQVCNAISKETSDSIKKDEISKVKEELAESFTDIRFH